MNDDILNSLQAERSVASKSHIMVIGVGGAGGNAVNYMHEHGIEDVDFVVCNTDTQAIYLLALFDKTDEENFVDRLVGCFATEQTDTELISAVNAEFGTAINPSDFTVAVQEIRDKYAEQEDDESG